MHSSHWWLNANHLHVPVFKRGERRYKSKTLNKSSATTWLKMQLPVHSRATQDEEEMKKSKAAEAEG